MGIGVVVMPVIVPMIVTVIVGVPVAVVIVPVIMVVAVAVAVAVVMVVAARPHLLLAGACADLVAELAFGLRAEAFHVMVVALLRKADFRLKTQHLLAIFTHLAVHIV